MTLKLFIKKKSKKKLQKVVYYHTLAAHQKNLNNQLQNFAFNQKTIKNSVTFQGVGLHSGKLVNLCLKSSEPDTGIIFKRTDLKNNNLVYPNFINVSNTSLNTTISNHEGVKISTISHDNLRIAEKYENMQPSAVF